MEIKDIISSGLLELYVMGIASAEEQHDVERWITQYPEVADEVRSIEAGLEIYAKVNAIAPDESVKEQLFSKLTTAASAIATDKSGPGTAIIKELPAAYDNVRYVSPNWKWAAAASVILLVGSIAGNFIYYNKYDVATKDVAQTKGQLVQQQQEMAAMKSDMNTVNDPNSMPVALKGQDVMPDAKAKIFWMQNTGDVMIDASALPDAPAGQQYQFWAIVNGAPVNGGMIITNDKGVKYHMQKMRSFGKADAFAISLEKTGGNPTPTKVVSMGKII